MKLLTLAMLALTFTVTPAFAQPDDPVDVDQLLNDFGRTAASNELELLVIHLNDLTTDALFEAPQKYVLRAQARGRTMFFVRGTATRDTTLTHDFRVLEGSAMAHRATVVNLSNMENGTELESGTEFLGILALDKLIPIRTKMTVTLDSMRMEFEFTPNVASQLQGE